MDDMNGEGTDPNLTGVRLQLYRLAASWWLGLALAGIAVFIVVSRWSTIDITSLVSVSPMAQLGASIVYGAGLFAMAMMPTEQASGGRKIISAGLSAQLLKYVPGSFWQGQRLAAVGGMPAVFQFGIGTLIAAGLALSVSGRRFAVVLGATVAVAGAVVCWRSWGRDSTRRIVAWGIVVAVAVFLSGALIGAGAGLGLFWSGREIAGAWGLGVVAIPVPAGLGIRELFLSLSSLPEAAAELGVVHRVVTFITDAAVGTVGVLGAMTARRSVT